MIHGYFGILIDIVVYLHIVFWLIVEPVVFIDLLCGHRISTRGRTTEGDEIPEIEVSILPSREFYIRPGRPPEPAE